MKKLVEKLHNWWYAKRILKAKLEARDLLLKTYINSNMTLREELNVANGIIVNAAEKYSIVEAANKTLKFKNTKLTIRNTVLESKVV